MAKKELKDLIIEAVEKTEGARIYRHYSGRNMFGRRCLGIKIDRNHNHFGVMARITGLIDAQNKDSALEFIELIENDMQEDALGKDTIVYFPSIDDKETD